MPNEGHDAAWSGAPPLKGFLGRLCAWYAVRPELTGITELDGQRRDAQALRRILENALQPVVLRNQLRGTALERVDFAEIKRRAGHFALDPRQKPPAVVQNYPGWVRQAATMTLADYVDQAILAADPMAPNPYPHYRNLRLAQEFAAALGLVAPAWLDESEYRAPCLWLGRRGSLTSTHTDPQDNFVFMVTGQKRFHVYSPADIPHLAMASVGNTLFLRSPVDPRQPDFAAYPRLRHARCVTFDLRPGDFLFLPVGWSHLVESLSDAFSYNYWLRPEAPPFFNRRPAKPPAAAAAKARVHVH